MKELIYKILLTLSVLFCCIQAWAQSDQQSMHDKYWFYRYRLTHEFLKKGLGSCGQPSGYSIPAASAYEKSQDLHFGDGTSFLGNYIGVLATEFRLLSNNGASQDQVNRVKEELYFALKAYERLDQNAEVLLNPKQGKCGDYINGFFIRDDISQDNYFDDFPTPKNLAHPNLNKSLTSDYQDAKDEDACNHDHLRYPTVDQISNLMVGFSLVVKSMGDDDSYTDPTTGQSFNFKSAAKTYTDKILTYLTGNDYKIPVPYSNGCQAENGGLEAQGLAYPLAEAGNKIVNGSFGGDPVVSFLSVPPYNPYSMAEAVPATSGLWQDVYNYPAGVTEVQYNYNNKDYNNAIIFQLAAIGNSWKMGLLSERTTIAVLTFPHWVCDGSDCLIRIGGKCKLSIPTGCHWAWDASIPVDIYCYKTNTMDELSGYITNFLFENTSVPNWLTSSLPLMCVPFTPLPEFSVNTTASALSHYANTTNSWYFPLLHEYLHDCGTYTYNAGALYNALNQAPCTGPHYKPNKDINNPPALNSVGEINWSQQSTDEGVYGWRVENRWENNNPAQNIPPADGSAWNGLDYMIAYNIDNIVRGGIDGFTSYQDELSRELLNKTYPVVTSPTVSKGSVASPLTEIGFETIFANNYTVNTGSDNVHNGNVTFHAGESIKITNFKAKAGSDFKAYIDPVFGCVAQNTSFVYKDVASSSSPTASAVAATSSIEKTKQSLIKQLNDQKDSIQNIVADQQSQQTYVPLASYLSQSNNSSVSDEASIFPNPASDKLFISKQLFDSDKLQVQISNVLGSGIMNQTFNVRTQENEIVQMDIQNLESGYYFCKVSCGTYSKTFQFLKK